MFSLTLSGWLNGGERPRHISGIFLRALILRDTRFIAATLFYCAIASVIATFQYSVFVSFMRAGAVIPRHLEGDFWVTASGVECFDFPEAISEDYSGVLARYAPGARYRRVVFGFTTWRSPLGKRSNVALVGIDGLNVAPGTFVADRSDLGRLGFTDRGPEEASAGEHGLTLGKVVGDLPTFLGVPYVLVPFDTGREILRMDPSSASYLVGNLPPGVSLDERALADARRRFPEISVVARDDFERSSSFYWLSKTGAGLAIFLAALLAGLLMTILLASGVSRFVQRYRTDLLSLLGHGATERDIAAIVAQFAAIVAIGTFVLTVIATPILVQLFRVLLPWIGFDPGDLVVPFLAVGVAFLIAITMARGPVRSFSPATVFRS